MGNLTLPFKLYYIQIIQHILIQALNDLFYFINSLIERNSALFTFGAEFCFNSASFNARSPLSSGVGYQSDPHR